MVLVNSLQESKYEKTISYLAINNFDPNSCILATYFKSFKSIRFGIPSCWHPRNTKKKREPKFSRKLIDTGLLTAMGYSQRGPYQKEKREGNLEIHVPK